MDSPTFLGPRTDTVCRPDKSTHNYPPSKLKTYGFIIAIIVGIGGLAIGGAGVAGYFHVGALSNMAQIDAIIMMAVSGGGGIIFLIVGIVGNMKNRKSDHRSEISSENRGAHSTSNNQDQLTCDTSDVPKTNFIETMSADVGDGQNELPSPSNNQDQCTRDTSDVRQTYFIDRTNKGTIRGAKRFGTVLWETHFGDVGDEPPLPENLDEILNSSCPFSGDEGVKVKDTHMLVLIPATVNGEDLTLNKLEELIKTPKTGNKTEYYNYKNNQAKHEHGGVKVERSHWVLMTRDVLPGSGGQTYDDQKRLIRKYVGQDYVIPDAIEAATCILVEFVVSGERLFDCKPLTFTRCAQITQNKYPVMVGRFYSDGLYVDENYSDFQCFGVAALRRWPHLSNN